MATIKFCCFSNALSFPSLDVSERRSMALSTTSRTRQLNSSVTNDKQSNWLCVPPAESKTEGVFPKEQLALEEAVRLEEMLISGSQRALSEVESIQWRKPPLQMGKVHQCFLGLLIAKLIIGNRFVVHLPEPTHSTSLPIMFKGVVYLSGCYLFLKNLLGF